MSDDLERRVGELEARLDAMSTWNEQLKERNEELEDRVAKLEELVDPDPGAVGYENLTKDQKVFRIRKMLAETAARTDGKAAIGYSEVIALFDGHPSPGHAYDLMERAAYTDGYAYDEAGQGRGNKRIRVTLASVNDETLIHAANNATDAGAA